MVNQVIYGIISFSKIIFGFLIITHIFPEKRWDKRWVEKLGWGIFIFLSIDQAWDSCHGFIPWLQIVLNGIMNAGILKIFYRCGFWEILLWNWFYDIAYSLLKIPVMIIRGVNLHQGASYVNVTGGRTQEEIILCLLQVCVIGIVYFKHLDKVEFLLKQIVRFKRRKALFLITEMIGLGLICMIIDLGAIRRYETIDITVSILMIFSMLMIFMLYMIYTMYIHSREEQRNLMIQQEILTRETGIITEYCRQDAKRLHDLKHTWVYLQNCLEEKKYEDALESICGHLEEVNVLQRQRWSGIPEIDVLLNYKYQKMLKHGIDFTEEIELYHLPVSGEDFMVILGNLLDNAIEAVVECETSERKVELSVKNVNHMFVLKIGNTCMERPESTGKRWKTSKDDPIHHGWGIANVKQIVERVGGELNYRCKKDWFEISILI